MDFGIVSYIAIFVVSLVALLKASDWFVDSSERIGLSLGISPFVIGVTIVAFGTSLPELASSVLAVVNGEPGIVTGNVLGSNVANICLVLGCVAAFTGTIRMEGAVLDIDVPVLVGSALALWAVSFDGAVDWLDGLLLIGLLVVFLINSFRSHGGDESVRVAAGWKAYALLLLGAVGVYFGAKYTVESITTLSGAMGIPSSVIAATMVAVGTSLPEIIVSLAAARKGKSSMAVGNVIGSNIFNTFGVMGIPALLGDIPTPASEVGFVLPYMIGLTVLLGFLTAANNVSRWEGVMLLGLYVVFLLQLF